MPDWVSAEAAVSVIRSGQRVLLGPHCAEPQALVEALLARREELRDVTLYTIIPQGACPYAQPGMEAHFRVVAFSVSPALREAVAEGRAEYIPCHYSEVPRLVERIGFDVALVQLSPPDAHGFCSLGICAGYLPSALRVSRLVVAEVNERMPRTLGNAFVPLSRVDLAVRSDRPPLTLPPPRIGEVERRLGERVAELVPDGATIQLGIGPLPTAVAWALRDKRDLGVHTGMFSDGMMMLMREGVVTNACKPIDRGKSVASDLLGTEELYRFAHDNPALELHPVTYTHSPETLRRLKGLVSVNAALQVDLTGQVNAETLGGRVVAGGGGQLDFVRGANAAPEGKAIIALSSTARGGTVSRIVPQLPEGSAVTVPRTDVGFVVTEHGVADLRGKTCGQRARELIGIAHPDFRDWLEHEARRLSLI